MPKENIEVLIEGGKATAAPPLGPALGPMGVNIGQVVTDINKKTQDFKGMQVPVTVSIDTDTKEYQISVGTPPASQLILKEAGVKKGAGNALAEKVADLKIEQIIKISNMKEDALLGKDSKQRVKEIMGTCQSMGILVEGKPANETIADVNSGKFDKQITSGKTELTEEEREELAEEKKKLAEEMEERKEEFTEKANQLISQLKGKTNSQIRNKMHDEGIPQPIIDELVPEEQKEQAQ